MKKYADVSKVVYDPKGTDPFTFRWYDPDEVIAGLEASTGYTEADELYSNGFSAVYLLKGGNA